MRVSVVSVLRQLCLRAQTHGGGVGGGGDDGDGGSDGGVDVAGSRRLRCT